MSLCHSTHVAAFRQWFFFTLWWSVNLSVSRGPRVAFGVLAESSRASTSSGYWGPFVKGAVKVRGMLEVRPVTLGH